MGADGRSEKVDAGFVTRVVLPAHVWREAFRQYTVNSLMSALGETGKKPDIRLFGDQHEDVLLLSEQGPGVPVRVSVLRPGTEPRCPGGTEPEHFGQVLDGPRVEGVWSGDGGALPEFSLVGGHPDPSEAPLTMMTYDPEVELYSRVEGIFETRKLAGKTVTIIGLGSLGSFCAEELVRCGVERFELADFDRLEPHNIIRHTCDLADLGRYKTRAVADRVVRVNPTVVAHCHEMDVLAARSQVSEVIADSSIVLVCTDNNASRFLVNELCLRHRVPAIYAGAYERAFGGHVLRVVPGETPCYECVVGGIMQASGNLPEPEKGRVAYVDAGQEEEFVAEPGLGLDVRFLALIQAKMALLTLLRNTETTLEDFPTDFVFWGNRKEWIFPAPLFAQYATTTFRDDCSACETVRGEMEVRQR